MEFLHCSSPLFFFVGKAFKVGILKRFKYAFNMFNGFSILPQPLTGILSTKRKYKTVFMIYQPSNISLFLFVSLRLPSRISEIGAESDAEDGRALGASHLCYDFCACKFAIINYPSNERIIIESDRLGWLHIASLIDTKLSLALRQPHDFQFPSISMIAPQSRWLETVSIFPSCQNFPINLTLSKQKINFRGGRKRIC